jgi:hypothetical protein
VSHLIGWISTSRKKCGNGAVIAPRRRGATDWTDYRPGMRHIGTLIAATVIAPLVWLLLAFGQGRSAQAFAEAQSTGVYHGGDFLRPLQALAAAGLLLGLIATLRLSPLGAVVAGIAYASSYVMLLIVPKRVLSFFGHDISIAGHHTDPTTPIRTGTTLVLGALLLVSAASVRRWQHRSRRFDGDYRLEREQERPLGLDGLGLTPKRLGAETETSTRYPTRPAPTGSIPPWVASHRDESSEAGFRRGSGPGNW